jgi:hypothetical protein
VRAHPGEPDKAATLNRVPAAEIETLIISALRKHLAEQSNNKVEAEGSHSRNDKVLISAYVARIDVKPDHLAIQLSVKPGHQSGERDQELPREGGTLDHSNPNIMVVPWRVSSGFASDVAHENGNETYLGRFLVR